VSAKVDESESEDEEEGEGEVFTEGRVEHPYRKEREAKKECPDKTYSLSYKEMSQFKKSPGGEEEE